MQYFADLLSCPPKVVDALLTVVMAYTKKSSNATKAFVGSVEFMRRLTVMCNKWGGDEIVSLLIPALSLFLVHIYLMWLYAS